ncbi:hypothetical protein [Natronomonas amylolytica]|uniref:hypothetical protein n=1 Tax=Natronomonas amylolytica TaxID=3108498 RepID=UPI0030086604
MRQRSETYLDAGGLSVALVSAEDIFLFKSVAGRTDDIEDMFALVQTELDFDVIEDELEQQIELLGQELFVTHTNEALLELEAQHNISTPLAERVSEITERVYQELEVLQAFEWSISRSEVKAAVDLPPDAVDDAIQHLTEKDVVAVDNDVIVRKSTNL